MHKGSVWSAGLILGALVLSLLVLPAVAGPSAVSEGALTPTPSVAGGRPGRGDLAGRDLAAPSLQVVIQPGDGDDVTLKDAPITDQEPDANAALGALLQRTMSPAHRSLLRWDLSSIPPGSAIQDAHLELHAFDRGSAQATTIEIYKVRVPWQETSVTWNQASTGSAWDEPGCSGEGTDREGSIAASTTIGTGDAVPGWYSWDVTSLVQGWFASPATNYGMILISKGPMVRYDFQGSEAGASDLRPKLVVEYAASSGTATPTPSATRSMTAQPSSTPTRTSSPTRTATPESWIDVSQAMPAYCKGVFSGDTGGKPNNTSRYGDLSWDESGPEDVYVLHKTVTSDLNVRLVWEDWGLDLDIFLLSGPDPDLLMPGGHGDYDFTYRDLQPGTYYIVVDGFEGSAGAYQLGIECEGEPTPTATITPTPSPTFTPALGFYPLVFRQPTPTPRPTPTYVPYALGVNCGSTEGYTYSDGFYYFPDQPYTPGAPQAWGYQGGGPGDVWMTAQEEIYDTPDDLLFRSHRYAMSMYRFSVPRAHYRVQLHFAEVFPYARVGSRVFAVEIEGQRVMDSFDMVAQGFKFTAHTEVFEVDVIDGELTVTFVSQSPEYAPAINGIRLVGIGPAS
ncbi:MAG: DNRLRE domain-containing protein [Anaerolineae bacterium]|nr:DNRLRE domain-containing protein [Anaerolineae bacterium]